MKDTAQLGLDFPKLKPSAEKDSEHPAWEVYRAWAQREAAIRLSRRRDERRRFVEHCVNGVLARQAKQEKNAAKVAQIRRAGA